MKTLIGSHTTQLIIYERHSLDVTLIESVGFIQIIKKVECPVVENISIFMLIIDTIKVSHVEKEINPEGLLNKSLKQWTIKKTILLNVWD